MERLGEGGPKDPRAAANTYKALTEAFHPAGTREWGRALLEGRGVARDVDEAVLVLKRAAVLRDGEASYLLAKLAEAGEGGLKPEEAATFAAEAAANGYVPPPASPAQ
jgi:TPR repeat protein